jgi:hypothetical protein
MSRREEWRKVLDSEVRRWSALSSEQLLAELEDLLAYEVEVDSKKYQVESPNLAECRTPRPGHGGG